MERCDMVVDINVVDSAKAIHLHDVKTIDELILMLNHLKDEGFQFITYENDDSYCGIYPYTKEVRVKNMPTIYSNSKSGPMWEFK